MKDFPRSVRVLVFARSGGVCEVCARARASHMHHRRLRGRQGPGDTHGAANCLHLCGWCHDLIHRDPAESTLLGYMVRSGVHPASKHVLRRGEWVHLGDDGSITPLQVPEPIEEAA